MGAICCVFSILIASIQNWKLCCNIDLTYEKLWNHTSLQKDSGPMLQMQPSVEHLLNLGGDLCWFIENMSVRAGPPFMVHSTFTATSLQCQVCFGFFPFFLLILSPGCLHSSCFCCAESQLFHKPWGNLPIQIRQVQRSLLKVLSWGSASVKPGPLKLAFE